MAKAKLGLPLTLDLPKKGKSSVGSWLTIPHAANCEIMAGSGFDWLVIDMEHSSITPREAEEMIRVINLAGLPALVRVGENSPYLIKRVMDCGASGVIVPMVNSAEDAHKAVRAVKYPPQGIRGVGLYRAQGYGRNFSEYVQWVQKQSRVIVQIEHIDAVNNLEKILDVDGVDGFIVGPYDLSASLGLPGRFEHKDVKAALAKIAQYVKKGLKPAGFHVVEPNARLVKEKIKEGYSFLAFGVDFLWLGHSCRDGMAQLKGSK